MLLGALLGGACALVPALWMWDFTVDDALISIRYARHLAEGAGYRFNVGGPCTDGVTPLPWPFLLAPFARVGALEVLARAKCIGLVVWTAAAIAWGAAIARTEAPRFAKGAAFGALALCVPVAAHAVSGMETALATALATAAAISFERPARAAALAGLAAALRPEMAPWALVVGLGAARSESPRSAQRTALAACLAAAPFIVCALVRVVAFGRPAPLAVLAKPADVTLGVKYALVAALVTGGPLLALAPGALVRGASPARALALAGLVHLAATAVAGGDWMPYARLVAPIAPSLLYASVVAAPHMRAFAIRSRAALALAFEMYLLVAAAPAGRRVGRDRTELVVRARAYLQDARSVATVDAGWPSAATEADIVDLAGVTDPQIAALPGGHTSKRVDPSLLLARDPDVLLLYADADVDAAHLDGWTGAAYPRALEARLARAELIESHFSPRAWLPLGDSGKGYVVLGRRPPP